jgi:hypothetical protein
MVWGCFAALAKSLNKLYFVFQGMCVVVEKELILVGQAVGFIQRLLRRETGCALVLNINLLG